MRSAAQPRQAARRTHRPGDADAKKIVEDGSAKAVAADLITPAIEAARARAQEQLGEPRSREVCYCSSRAIFRPSSTCCISTADNAPILRRMNLSCTMKRLPQRIAEIALSPDSFPSGVFVSTSTWVGSRLTRLRFVVTMTTTAWLSRRLRIRLNNQHGPYLGTARVGERQIHHDHVAAPVVHFSALSCQSSGSTSARSGYMPNTSCSSSNIAWTRA